MKLEDWMHENLGEIFFDDSPAYYGKHKTISVEQQRTLIIQKESSRNNTGLHVIGNCGECKWYEPMLGTGGYDCMGAHDIDYPIDFPPKDFGCIHFEAKGEK